jgi:hypothetical protein
VRFCKLSPGSQYPRANLLFATCNEDQITGGVMMSLTGGRTNEIAVG